MSRRPRSQWGPSPWCQWCATVSKLLPAYGDPRQEPGFAEGWTVLPMCERCEARRPGSPRPGACFGVGEDSCGRALHVAANTCGAAPGWAP